MVNKTLKIGPSQQGLVKGIYQPFVPGTHDNHVRTCFFYPPDRNVLTPEEWQSG